MLQQAAKQTASMLVQNELTEIAQNEEDDKTKEDQMSDDDLDLSKKIDILPNKKTRKGKKVKKATQKNNFIK